MRSSRTSEPVGRVTCCHHSHIWHANWNGMQNGYRRSIVRRQTAIHACTVLCRGTMGLVVMYAQQSYVGISRAGHLLSPFSHLASLICFFSKTLLQAVTHCSDHHFRGGVGTFRQHLASGVRTLFPTPFFQQNMGADRVSKDTD